MRTDSEWSPGPGVKVSSRAGPTAAGSCLRFCLVRHGVQRVAPAPAAATGGVSVICRTYRLKEPLWSWRSEWHGGDASMPVVRRKRLAIAFHRSWFRKAAEPVVSSIWPVCLPILPEAGQLSV